MDDGLLREAVLRRVADAPCAEELVLRGGMRTRLLCPAVPRRVEDVDFLALFPFSPEGTVARLRQACSRDPGDGVVLDTAALEATVIWADTPFPGVRLRIPARCAETQSTVQVDIGFGDPLVPPAQWLSYPTARGELRLLACRAETLLGWKVHGLFERGYGQWRPKDLWDVYLLLHHAALDPAWLVPALHAAFASRNTPFVVAHRLLYGPFGHSRGSQAKWQRFRAAGPAAHIPEDVKPVVEAVAAALRPLFAPWLDAAGPRPPGAGPAAQKDSTPTAVYPCHEDPVD